MRNKFSLSKSIPKKERSILEIILKSIPSVASESSLPNLTISKIEKDVYEITSENPDTAFEYVPNENIAYYSNGSRIAVKMPLHPSAIKIYRFKINHKNGS